MSNDPQARELWMRARVLRFFALIFAIAGTGVFIALYLKNVQGTFLSSLSNPFVIVMILVPFLPAIVLSKKASKLEKQYTAKYGKVAEKPPGEA